MLGPPPNERSVPVNKAIRALRDRFSKTLTVTDEELRVALAPFCNANGALTEAGWAEFYRRHADDILHDGGGERGSFAMFGISPEWEWSAQAMKRKAVAVLEGFFAGGLAGAVSKTVIAPGDRVKIIFQVNRERRFSLTEAVRLARRLVETGGLLSLWAGHGATLLRVVPYASITFVSFDAYHRWLRAVDFLEGHPVALRFVGGSLAGITATACTYPLDLLRARFAVASVRVAEENAAAKGEGEGVRRSSAKVSYIRALRDIYVHEGARALYSGVGPTLIGIAPYAGVSFAVFETLKNVLAGHSRDGSTTEIPTAQRVVAGGIAGVVAQSMTYPLDIVRRRMQVNPTLYRGMGHALVTIFRTEGMRGLFKGLTMNWIKGPIAVGCSFTVNDVVKNSIAKHKAARASSESSPTTRLRPTEPGQFGLDCFIFGGLAGGVAKLWTIPFDRVKLFYLIGQYRSDGTATVRQRLAELFRESPNPWQGSGIMLARVVPYAALTYGLFEIVGPLRPKPSRLGDAMAGALAATVATVALYPLDLLRIRHATSKKGRGFIAAARSVVAAGGWRALWEGLPRAVVGIAPMAGISFAVYRGVRESIGGENFAARLMAGAVAGGCAQMATYPLNLRRREAQVRAEHFHPPDSLRGVYRRVPLGWVVGPMTVGLSFAVYETSLEWYRRESALAGLPLATLMGRATKEEDAKT